MSFVSINHKNCKGSKCAACAYICPTNVFTIEKNIIYVTSPDSCKLCGDCLEICSNKAINIKRSEIPPI